MFQLSPGKSAISALVGFVVRGQIVPKLLGWRVRPSRDKANYIFLYWVRWRTILTKEYISRDANVIAWLSKPLNSSDWR
jgi:hypothetical protein